MLNKLLPALVCAATLAAPAAFAQGGPAWPTAKPITLVVPFSAGGSVDYAARLVATQLAERLKQAVVVENVTGAGGAIGVGKVVQAAPDGYTLVMGADSPIAIAKLVNPAGVPYDALRDLAPVALVNTAPMVLTARPDLPAQTVLELAQLAKSQPGKLTYATSGIGTVLHLAMELLKERLQIDITHVPYRGGAQMLTDLIGGQVDLAILVAPSALPNVRSGKIKALGLTGDRRLAAAKDIPALAERPELRGYEMVTWIGVFAPAKTPGAITERLNKALNEVLAMPEVRAKFEEQGAQAGSGSVASFAGFVKSEHAKYERIVKAANIRE